MHYAGLYALRLKPGIDALAQQEAPTHALLVFSIVGVVVLVFGLVLAVNMTLRYRQIYRQLQCSESRLSPGVGRAGARAEVHPSALRPPLTLICRLLLV